MRPLALFALILLCGYGAAAEIVEVTPVHDRLLLVHFDEGYVKHHQRGQPRSQEEVVISPLDLGTAMAPTAYRISSKDDPAFVAPMLPLAVHRKSKGTDYAWFVDNWINNMAVNNRPDHTKEHWVYLTLPAPLQPGKTYTLDTGVLGSNGRSWTVAFDVRQARSESVHVNLLGYVPDAPQKFGYVYQWAGNLGGVDFKAIEGKRFWLVDQATGKDVFEGKVAFRAPATLQETANIADSPPNGNFLGAPVWECDFSAFQTPGRYRLAVEGVGASFPFEIGADVYRPAFRAVARALYHNRSGIALTKPYTEFERPAPHNPKLTPGFAGKLMYTSVRMQEWGSEGGDRAKLEAGFKGPLDAWGWYQDAGDWDSYVTHLRAASELLVAYEIAPGNFRDGELNIPESKNGLPDILDEAAWLPRFCHRLRQELLAKKYGTGGIGLRIAGDAFGTDEGTKPDGSKFGRGSWEDTDRTWAVSGEDPVSTVRYAGVAAHLALCLEMAKAKDPEGVDWRKEAEQAYAWALKNTRPGDENEVRPFRRYAAASLFRLTRDRKYEAQFEADVKDVAPTSLIYESDALGPMLYALGRPGLEQDSALRLRMRSAVLNTADEMGIRTPERRALRWGGNFFFPMLVGQQTTPNILEVAVGWALTRTAEPERAARYRGALYATCDYFLGANAMNTVMMTGVGPRSVRQIFHMDAWYNGKGRFHEGLIPYGQWRKEKDVGQGPWDQAWGHKTVFPAIDAWPGNERFFENRCSPMGAEFTVHQNLGPAAAMYGILCGPAK